MCKEQGRIHRNMLNSDYYEFQLHEGELQPSIRTRIGSRGLTSPLGVVSHCPYHCNARVAQKIRSIQTYRCLHLPPCFQGSPHNVLGRCKEPSSNCGYRSCSLPHLRGHLTARADGGHALPLGSLSKTFNLTFILPSLLVRFSALNWIKPHIPLVVVLPRQFL